MFNYIKSIKKIIKRKNAQIRAEREKLEAAETANRIYAAYIVWFASKHGEVSVPKREISALLGKYRADVSYTSDDYIISVKPIGEPYSLQNNTGEGVSVGGAHYCDNGESAGYCQNESPSPEAETVGSGNGGEDSGEK